MKAMRYTEKMNSKNEQKKLQDKKREENEMRQDEADRLCSEFVISYFIRLIILYVLSLIHI